MAPAGFAGGTSAHAAHGAATPPAEKPPDTIDGAGAGLQSQGSWWFAPELQPRLMESSAQKHAACMLSRAGDVATTTWLLPWLAKL